MGSEFCKRHQGVKRFIDVRRDSVLCESTQETTLKVHHMLMQQKHQHSKTLITVLLK